MNNVATGSIDVVTKHTVYGRLYKSEYGNNFEIFWMVSFYELKSNYCVIKWYRLLLINSRFVIVCGSCGWFTFIWKLNLVSDNDNVPNEWNEIDTDSQYSVTVSVTLTDHD